MSSTTPSNTAVAAGPASHPAFRLLRRHPVPTLQVVLEEYEHTGTGARHLHLASDSDENVFLVALRTFPMDSTGVAHILEHTALCGSERYPVRDPFFMMIRRSLNTFMNAFTSSDWTAYPFASKNRKDFDNLLSVYLDAVFFAKLDPLDFAQEGHRLEFAEPNNPESPLVYKGVVYNEMKGAMSSPASQLWQDLTSYLFPSTTYHYNSGGDPEHIVDLSYDDLLAFYRRHYHPSNALFATFGNIPAVEHQARFEALALSRFERQRMDLPVHDEKRYHAPVRVQQAYPVNPGEPLDGRTHIVMGWLLGHSFDLEQNLEAHLLSSVLMENSASPLMKALETSDLGASPSPLCGLEDSNREMTFVCGLEGSEPERQADLEQLVETVLREVVEQGVSQERLEAVLHQLELHQREISGDHYPYGLQLILTALSPMVHGGDPVGLLDLDPVLARLREKIKAPDYVPDLVRRLLLDNPHRVTLTLVPDADIEARRHAAVERALAARKARMSSAEQQAVIELAEALKVRQERKDDESVLPRVGIEDVPVSQPEPLPKAYPDVPITGYGQGTNGLVYQQIALPLPALNEDDQALLSIYTTCIAETGCGDLDYLAMQDRLSAYTGGVGAYTSVKGRIDDVQQVDGYLIYSSKSLLRNHDRMSTILRDVVERSRFDEAPRIRELVAQIRARREQSVTGSGHSLAMGAAAQGLSPTAALSFRTGGLASIRAIKLLDQALREPAELDALCQRLGALHQRITGATPQFLAVAEPEHLDAVVAGMRACWPDMSARVAPTFALPPVAEVTREAWLTNTQVNFCAMAFPTVAVDHPDAASLTVLGGFLRNGYLHRAIREQGGAYGGGASQDSIQGAFRFYSYRDPRLEETLDDFTRALHWLMDTRHEVLALEEAILGVIGQLDKPRSPAGEAKHHFHGGLFGRDAAQRQRFRERVLGVTLDDLRRVTQAWLVPERASTAVITAPSERARVEQRGLVIQEL